MKVLENSLGTDNNFTAIANNNLARLCVHLGKYSQAQELCEKSLRTLENVFDKNHPNVADVLETMVLLYQNTGNVARAAELGQRANQIRQSKQVPLDLTATVINN